MQEFYVNNFRVDIARNQIVHEGRVIALEPKVLAVLQVLAAHPGQVVSHQTLLDTVWPNLVVAPNALQRCIGQLRKAFNDDGKSQAVIQTHPKQGYSLVAGVSVRSDITDLESNQTQVKLLQPKFKAVALVVVLLLLLVIAMWPSQQGSMQQLNRFDHLIPLTTTDSSEFYSVFSPDGRYLAFSRSSKGGYSHIWLKDLLTNKESRITSSEGFYGQPNWSEDGQRLAFTNLSGCGSDCNNRRCVNVDILFVPLALTEPQPTTNVLRCRPIPHQGLQWLDSQRLVFIENNDDHHQLIAYHIETKREEVLYTNSTSRPYALSYSFQTKQLAVMQQTPTQAIELVLVQPESKKITQAQFTSPAEYGFWEAWNPVWDHKGENLLFSGGNRLYIADTEGGLNSHVIPTFHDISRPMFQPDGKAIAMTLGKVDRDLAELSLNLNAKKANLYRENKLARSILREGDAQYQPGGDAIAFFSERSGSKQLWLLQEEQLTQVSDNDAPIPLEYFVWSPNGKRLAAIANRTLFLYDMEGNKQSIQLGFRAVSLFQWTQNNQLLMTIDDDKDNDNDNDNENGNQLALFDIATNALEIVQVGHFRWAQITGDTVIASDVDNRLSQIIAGAKRPIAELEQIETWSRFFIRDQFLYLLSGDDHFWRFDLTTNELQLLFHYPDASVAISDVAYDQNAFLISKFVSAKKEIVMLKPSK